MSPTILHPRSVPPYSVLPGLYSIIQLELQWHLAAVGRELSHSVDFGDTNRQPAWAANTRNTVVTGDDIGSPVGKSILRRVSFPHLVIIGHYITALTSSQNGV